MNEKTFKGEIAESYDFLQFALGPKNPPRFRFSKGATEDGKPELELLLIGKYKIAFKRAVYGDLDEIVEE